LADSPEYLKRLKLLAYYSPEPRIASFLSGFDLYAARLDKGYSFTGCIIDANHAQRRADPETL